MFAIKASKLVPKYWYLMNQSHVLNVPEGCLIARVHRQPSQVRDLNENPKLPYEDSSLDEEKVGPKVERRSNSSLLVTSASLLGAPVLTTRSKEAASSY